MSSTSSQGLTALGSALLGLSTIAITLRFYARHTQKTPVKSDDWIMIPCLVSTQSLEAANRHKKSSTRSSSKLKVLRGYSYCFLERQRVHLLVGQVDDPPSTVISVLITLPFRSGVQKKVMGYPTPKDPQVRAETAEMTSKVSYRS